MNPPLAAPIDPASGTIPLPRLSTILHPTKKQPLDQVCQTPPKGCFSHDIIIVYRKLYSVACQTIPASKPCEIRLQAFSRQQSLASILTPAIPRETPQLYAVGFAGFGSLSAMTFIRLSVHLIGSANFASPTTASLASSAGFSTPPRTSSTTAYL